MASLDEMQRHPGAIEAARDRLIQTLTRIEDAELMLSWRSNHILEGAYSVAAYNLL
jgi:hypothetical protein